jgi:hypothetical protein
MIPDVAWHIGFHKTGTTWLQKVFLSGHPEIVLLADWRRPSSDALLREMIVASDSCFDRDRAQALLSDRLTGCSNGSVRLGVVSAERLSGHPASGGFDAFRIAERIAAVSPEGRVVAFVRNQVDLLQSVYVQLVNEGYRGTFSNMIEEEGWKTPAFSMAMYEFDRLLVHYQDLIGAGRVAFLSFDDFRRDRTAVLERLCDFLGVSRTQIAAQAPRENPTMDARRVPALRLLNQFRATELNRYPIVTFPNVRRFLGGLARLIQRTDPWTPQLVTLVKQRFYESNQRFERLSGIDLNAEIEQSNAVRGLSERELSLQKQ